MATTKRPQPNVDNPLSEPTLGRRLWAAYLKAGFTRASFAREIDVAYHTLDAWDMDRATPDLMAFTKAAEAVGYTMDELVSGKRAADKPVSISIPFLLSCRAFARMEELFARGYSLARIVGIGLAHASIAEGLPTDEDKRDT